MRTKGLNILEQMPRKPARRKMRVTVRVTSAESDHLLMLAKLYEKSPTGIAEFLLSQTIESSMQQDSMQQDSMQQETLGAD